MQDIMNPGSAAPMFLAAGAHDLSTRPMPVVYPTYPSHFPKFYFFSPFGSYGPHVVDGNALKTTFGEELMNKNSDWFKPYSKFMEVIIGNGNIIVAQRLKAPGSTRAGLVIYVDIKETDIPNYVRNSTGDYALDSDGNKILDSVEPTIPGLLIKYITEERDPKTEVGMVKSKNGTMTGSTMYPIIELTASSDGEYYNNKGIVLSPHNINMTSKKTMQDMGSFPIKLQMVTRDSRSVTPIVNRTVYEETESLVVFKNKSLNPMTSKRVDIERVLKSEWKNTTNTSLPMVYSPYEDFVIYRDNITQLIDKIIEHEAPLISAIPVVMNDGKTASTLSWYDYTSSDPTTIAKEAWLTNFLTLKTLSGIPYQAVRLSTDYPTLTNSQNEISFATGTPIYMTGGKDGDISWEAFENAISLEMDKYIDPGSDVQNLSLNPETYMYDVGYTLATTKDKLYNFIGYKKNTCLLLQTHQHKYGNNKELLSNSRAIAALLLTKAALVPESVYFGTEAARALIAVGNMDLKDESVDYRMSTLLDIADKLSRFAGASDGKWKPDQIFDSFPNNAITLGVDISPKDVPDTLKPSLWDSGATWAQPKDTKTYHFPAFQTITKNDTSVLNNFFVTMALTDATMAAYNVWQSLSGIGSKTDAQFKKLVEDRMEERLSGKFGGIVIIVPTCEITENDKIRGFSYKIRTDIYGNNQKTVATHYSNVYRMSDLEKA